MKKLNRAIGQVNESGYSRLDSRDQEDCLRR